MSVSPFDYVNTASYSKENIMRGTDNDELMDKDYNAWIVNLAFSNHPDTIGLSNEINQRPDMPNRAQYEVYLYGLRKKKRYGWIKNEGEEKHLDVISKTYSCNKTVAKQYLKLLNEEQLRDIHALYETGGKTQNI